MNWRSSNSSMTNTVALILGLFAFVFPGRAQSQDFDLSLSKDRPLLEVDLGKFGYDTSSSTKRLPKFIDFTDSNRIALGWLTFDDPTVAEKTGPLTAKPAHRRTCISLYLTLRQVRNRACRSGPRPPLQSASWGSVMEYFSLAPVMYCVCSRPALK